MVLSVRYVNSLRNFNNVLLFLHAVEAARDHIDGWYPVFLPVSKGLCGLSGFGLCVVSSGLCMQSPPVSTSLSGLCSFCCEHRPKPPRLQRPLETGKKNAQTGGNSNDKRNHRRLQM